MVICGQIFSPETLGLIQRTVDAEPGLSRRGLARRVCEWLRWRDRKGRLKEASSRKALVRLEQRGKLRLPKVQSLFLRPKPPPKSTPAKAPEVAEAKISCSLGQLTGIHLEIVGSRSSRSFARWKTMMDRHHPLGSGHLIGAQIRYLIHSDQGLVGGMSFSAASWKVLCREEWIAWSDDARRENLSLVVNNSRFLILPTVGVPLLASHVLSLVCRRLREDWQERHGDRPVLLETYVDTNWRGTCYKAANWIKVGMTSGRGRQDENSPDALRPKAVWMYPLHKQWRSILCHVPATARVLSRPLLPSEPVPCAGDWVENEFGLANLGDPRLNRRLLTMARDFYARLGAQVPESCEGKAKARAAYRFLDNPLTDMQKILAPHYEATERRCREEKVVLALQDTSFLNYTTHETTEGLGPIGKKDCKAVGLVMHDTLAVNTEGTPLGLLYVDCWARDPKDEDGEETKEDSEISLVGKESFKWIDSYRQVCSAKANAPDTRFVSVGDREADIYELFTETTDEDSDVDLLIRCRWDRSIKTEDGQEKLKIWSAVESQIKAGKRIVSVPRRKGGFPAREAEMEIRFCRVTLKPPQNKRHLKPIEMYVLQAKEQDPPKGATRLEWMLLTTIPVLDKNTAFKMLDWYALRWQIEVYHKTLKSGCKIENRQLGNADRIESCLAIDLVAAWRVFHLAKLGRETPDVPCTVFFEEPEWRALVAKVKNDRTWQDAPPTLGEAIRWVATMGGFLGGKRDNPGTQTLWRGLEHLHDMTAMWIIMADHDTS